MATFKDGGGREWSPAVTVFDLPGLAKLGVDLSAATASVEGFGGLFETPPEIVAGALWSLCRREAEARGLTPDDFARLFDGDTLESATFALAEAACDFFRFRPICRAIRGRVRAVMEATPDPSPPPPSNGSAGAWVANSGSTHARSASASSGG